jgi:hypothetical protein
MMRMGYKWIYYIILYPFISQVLLIGTIYIYKSIQIGLSKWMDIKIKACIQIDVSGCPKLLL